MIAEPLRTIRKRPPLVTLVLLCGCSVGFVIELVVGRPGVSRLVLDYGIVPSGVVAYFARAEGATFVNTLLPFFTSIFLHGSIIHVAGNLLFLYVFGEVVEDWLGWLRFLTLVVFGVAGELLVHMGMSDSPSQLASVGITGAVAALIGAFLVILLRLPAASDDGSTAASLLKRLPLAVVALSWFPLQMLNDLFLQAPTIQTMESPSWIALGGSFALGVFLLSLSGSRRMLRADAPPPAPVPRPDDLPPFGHGL